MYIFDIREYSGRISYSGILEYFSILALSTN